MSIEKLKAIAAKRSDTMENRIAFEDMVDNCFDEMLAVIDRAEAAITEMICTCTKKTCERCNLHKAIQAFHTKIQTELGSENE